MRIRPRAAPRRRRGGRAPAPRIDAAVDAVVAADVGGDGESEDSEAESGGDFSDPFEGEDDE